MESRTLKRGATGVQFCQFFFLRIHNFWTRETLAICRETLAICRERWRFVEWLKNISKIQNVFSIFVGFQIFFRISVPKHRENPLAVCMKTPRISENIHLLVAQKTRMSYCCLQKYREYPFAVCTKPENTYMSLVSVLIDAYI